MRKNGKVGIGIRIGIEMLGLIFNMISNDGFYATVILSFTSTT